MSATAYNLLPEMRGNTAATDTNCTAAALAELFAAFVSFQWHQPSHPPTQNVYSAASPLLPAVQFSGNNAICATNAATTTTSVTYWAFESS